MTGLARTANIFETVFTGSRADADEALERVHNLHSRVKGELARDAGTSPAGTPCDALDPRQMLWTLSCIADSGQVVYERLVRPLDGDERERLWQDYVRFGELFGMPRSAAPTSYPEFREWFDGRLDSDEVHLTPESREIGRIVALEIPGAPHERPALAVANLLVLGLLPERVREMYGLPWGAAQAAAFRVGLQRAQGGAPDRPEPNPPRPQRGELRPRGEGRAPLRERAGPAHERRGRGAQGERWLTPSSEFAPAPRPSSAATFRRCWRTLTRRSSSPLPQGWRGRAARTGAGRAPALRSGR